MIIKLDFESTISTNYDIKKILFFINFITDFSIYTLFEQKIGSRIKENRNNSHLLW